MRGWMTAFEPKRRFCSLALAPVYTKPAEVAAEGWAQTKLIDSR